jgi:hypothetical protein
MAGSWVELSDTAGRLSNLLGTTVKADEPAKMIFLDHPQARTLVTFAESGKQRTRKVDNSKILGNVVERMVAQPNMILSVGVVIELVADMIELFEEDGWTVWQDS